MTIVETKKKTDSNFTILSPKESDYPKEEEEFINPKENEFIQINIKKGMKQDNPLI